MKDGNSDAALAVAEHPDDPGGDAGILSSAAVMLHASPKQFSSE